MSSLKMDTHFIFEQVQKMRPSSFSEEERHCYQAEKMMLRQFMLMKQQDQVPDYLSVKDMKTWLLTGRNFLEEFQEIIERTGINHLFMAELAWTTVRHFCLSQMEEELLEELDEEMQLSQLFSRKVTLEGLQMFVSVVRPAAEEDVQTFLPSLHSKLLRIFGGIQITSSPLSAGDAKPAELLELEQSAAPLVPEVVDTALKFLLEGPERENKSEAASAEIGKLLTTSAAPCLSQFGSISKTLLLGVCTIVARHMVKSIYKRFDERSKSFHQMDYDESFFSAKDGVICAIQDMDHEVHLQLCTSEQLEEGLLEKTEASPRVSLDEEMATDKEETLVQESAIQNMDHKVQTDASTQGHVGLSSSDGLEEQLLEKREAFPQVCLDEELTTIPSDVTEDTFLVKPDANVAVYLADELQQEEVKESEKEETLDQDSAIQNMDHEVQTDAYTQGQVGLSSSEGLEERHLEKREASPQVAATEGPEEQYLEKREASQEVSVGEEVATVQNDVTKDTSLVRLKTELEVLQLEEVEPSETQESLVQDCDVKKKKGVRDFFRGFWEKMTCCVCVSTED